MVKMTEREIKWRKSVTHKTKPNNRRWKTFCVSSYKCVINSECVGYLAICWELWRVVNQSSCFVGCSNNRSHSRIYWAKLDFRLIRDIIKQHLFQIVYLSPYVSLCLPLILFFFFLSFSHSFSPWILRAKLPEFPKRHFIIFSQFRVKVKKRAVESNQPQPDSHKTWNNELNWNLLQLPHTKGQPE